LTFDGTSGSFGATTINAGRILIGSPDVDSLGELTLANVAGAELDLQDFNVTVSSLSGGGANGGNIVVGASSAATTLSIQQSETTTYAGVISGPGGVDFRFNGGTLTLSGANTFTGGLSTQTGVLRAGAAGTVFGAGELNNGAMVELAGFAVTVGRLVGSGMLTTGGASGGLTVGDATDFTYSGSFSGLGSLTKVGVGQMTLSANTAFAQAMVQQGTLRIGDGSTTTFSGGVQVTGATATFIVSQNATVGQSVAVSAGSASILGTVSGGATITGTGFLRGGNSFGTPGTVTGAVSVTGGGTFGPAAGGSELNTGNLTIGTGGVFAVELSGTEAGVDFSQAIVTGTVSLTGSTFAPTLNYIPTAGDSYLLISNNAADAVVGTFTGLAEGATVMVGGRPMSISYRGGDGNDVVLTDGAVVMDTTAPTAIDFFGQDVSAATPNTTIVEVTYADADSGVDAGTFGVDDVTVSNGAMVTGFSVSGNTVTYTITAPAATWLDSPQGSYSVSIVAGGVLDVAGNPIAAAAGFGSFEVDVPLPPPVDAVPPT
ncbi:MAG: beta strand repeat-containing protein, partial [Planctomycetia bacterium]